MKLKTQAHIGPLEPSADHFKPLGNHEHGWGKPMGGFWTSTLETLTEDGWVGWCRAEEYGGVSDKPVEVWTLEPTDARVYVVDGEAAVLDIHERYGVPSEIGFGERWRGLDWKAIAEDYDAVRLTNPYSPGVRFNKLASTFYGWDCESTVWLRWCFTNEVGRTTV